MAHRKVCIPITRPVPDRVRFEPTARDFDPARPRLVHHLFWRTIQDGWAVATLGGFMVSVHTCGQSTVCEVYPNGVRKTRPEAYATLSGALRALDWKVVD